MPWGQFARLLIDANSRIGTIKKEGRKPPEKNGSEMHASLAVKRFRLKEKKITTKPRRGQRAHRRPRNRKS